MSRREGALMCVRKIAFMLRRDAVVEAERVTRNSHEQIHAYLCPDCHLWHVGHDRRA